MTSGSDLIIKVRLLHGAFLTTLFLFVLVCRLAGFAEQPVPTTTVLAIALLAVADIAFGTVTRRRLFRGCEESFQGSSDLSRALARWKAANIISFAHAESVALLGLVLKFLGVSWIIAAPFFAVAVAIMLLWTPRTPRWFPSAQAKASSEI